MSRPRPQPQPPFRRPNYYKSQNYHNDGDGHSTRGHGNQPRFPNRDGGGNYHWDRCRGSRPPNSFNRFFNNPSAPNGSAPQPPLTLTPTFFRQDYVQNSTWQRPSTFYNGFAPRPSPSSDHRSQPGSVDDYYLQDSRNNYYNPPQQSATYNYSEQPWSNPAAHQSYYYDNGDLGHGHHGHDHDGQNRGRGCRRGRGQGFPRPGRGRGRGNSNGRRQANKSTSGQNSDTGRTHKPWITPELYGMIRTRNLAERKSNFTRNPADREYFTKLRIKTASALNFAKFNYEITHGSQKKTLLHCDSCDKSCGDQESLDAHKAEHMVSKKSLDGCRFTDRQESIVRIALDERISKRGIKTEPVEAETGVYPLLITPEDIKTEPVDVETHVDPLLITPENIKTEPVNIETFSDPSLFTHEDIKTEPVDIQTCSDSSDPSVITHEDIKTEPVDIESRLRDDDVLYPMLLTPTVRAHPQSGCPQRESQTYSNATFDGL